MQRFVFLVLLVSIFGSCLNKEQDVCPSPKEYIYNLGDSDRAKLPYAGIDSLIFISDSNNTVILFPHGRIDSFALENLHEYPVSCPQNVAKHQFMYVEFTSDSVNYFEGLKIGVYQYEINKYFPNTRSLVFKNSLFYISCPIDYLNSTYYTDTIHLVNGSVENVIKINSDDMYCMYYNHTKGLVAFKTDRLWRLAK